MRLLFLVLSYCLCFFILFSFFFPPVNSLPCTALPHYIMMSLVRFVIFYPVKMRFFTVKKLWDSILIKIYLVIVADPFLLNATVVMVVVSYLELFASDIVWSTDLILFFFLGSSILLLRKFAAGNTSKSASAKLSPLQLV
ncbi:hypothetical protein Dimus_024518 [Dionaea muscipula]